MRDNYGKIIKSENLITKKAKGIDNIDLGEIQNITTEYIITIKTNSVLNKNKDKIFIPRNLVERWDEDNVWFQVTEEEIESFKENQENF
ncbi:MAG TPA: hypothetical protein VK882_07840 [Nitrososphaeraceae archaeon]|jgi:hypothetical protein|nr:hypothetical protein [Nitrososphaeraceae archaeon]